jgi:hypothetical protein
MTQVDEAMWRVINEGLAIVYGRAAWALAVGACTILGLILRHE